MGNRKVLLGAAGGVVALAALVVILVLAATHHRTAAKAPTTPTPSPPASLTPSPSPTPSPTSTVGPTTASPSPATKAASPPPASPAGPGNGLVASPYGFSYPGSWSLSRLLVRTAVATTATATAPSGPGRLDYLSDTSPTAYYPDHTSDHLGIEAAIISLFPSCTRFASLNVVPNKGFVYTCTPTAAGGEPVHVNGTVLVAPYPKGFRVLQVVLPAADDAQATAILNTFH